jgi:PAS domain S-box-containing protein
MADPVNASAPEVARFAGRAEEAGPANPALEAALNDLTRLAAHVCGAAAAAMAWEAADGRWRFRAVQGMATESESDHALFRAALAGTRLVGVEDVTADPRFGSAPLVIGGRRFVSVAAVPLCETDGPAKGLLCVFDAPPRSWEPAQRSALEVLGRQVVCQLELQRHRRELDERIASHERSEAALRQSEANYRSIFENVVEGIFQTTVDGRYLSANPRLARIYGYDSPEELMQAVQNISRQLYVEFGRREAFVRQIRTTGEVNNFESQIYRKDGSVIWISENARAVRNAAGEVLYYEGTVQDITDRKLAEAALLDSEALYHSLVECLPQNIFRKDLEGRFTFVNRLFCQTLGRPPEAILGRTDFDFFPKHLAEKYQADDRRVVQTLEGEDTIEEHVRPDGAKIYVHVLKTPLYDAQGSVIGVQGIFWDVTERRRIEESLAYERDLLQALLDNLPDAIYFKDEQSRFVRCSRAMIQRFGLKDQAEIVGHTDFDFFGEEHARLAFQDEQRIIRTGQPIIGFTEKETWPDGRVTWVLSSKLPYRDRQGKIVGTFGVSKDITDLIAAEQNLEKAAQTALEMAQVKAQFLANMSHEIRTPMNAIIGWTAQLLDTPLSAEQREFAETVRRSADALLDIINSILDFSRLEAGRMTLEAIDFDLVELVETTVEFLAERAHASGLEVICQIPDDFPCRLHGDPGRLRQVLTNLIGNAVKFTPAGEIVVRVASLLETANQVTLRCEVQDTGIGINPDTQDRLFEAFVQADGSTTRRYGGTGLGLAISRQIIALMDGRIGVSSELGRGSTFWFEISLPKQAGAAGSAFGPDPGLAGKRALIVDDSAAQRAALRNHLTHWGMQTAEAGSGRDALDALQAAAGQATPFDVILLDFQLPDVDGLTLVESINRDPTLTGVRFVILTSLQQRLDAAVAANAGFSACLIKPPRRARLRDTLVRVIAGPPAPTPAVACLPSAATSAGESTVRPLRVLLAEDNLVNQRLALLQLRKLGYAAEPAGNGHEVLAALAKADFDVLVLDCQMPDLDGYETARRIRRQEMRAGAATAADQPPIYIIAMTANAMRDDREKCLAAGMDDYISKPVRLADLAAALQRAARHLPPRPVPSEPPADKDAGAALPTLDLAVLRGLRELGAPGEPDAAAELVALFLREAEPACARMEKALTEQNADALRATAHSLKGSAGNLGAHRLAALATKLEQQARNGVLAESPTVFAQLQAELQSVRRQLEAELARPAASGSP